jgi:putative FmdB family regulatory protein
MPTYEYRCQTCGEVTALMAYLTEDYGPPPCTMCGGVTQRIWTATPVHFKGSGFYKTDKDRK